MNRLSLLLVGIWSLLVSCNDDKERILSQPVKIQVEYTSIDSIKADPYFSERVEILDSVTRYFGSIEHGEFLSPIYKVDLTLLPDDYLTDYENVFKMEQRNTLNYRISDFEKRTSNEIGIVTLPVSFLKNNSFDSLVLECARKWGVGKAKMNNGVFIGICSTAKRIRIYTAKGIEKKLTDTECANLINSFFIPELKKDGLYSGVNRIIELIEFELGK